MPFHKETKKRKSGEGLGEKDFSKKISFQVFALSKEQMQSLSASYGGQRRRDLSLADWPALHEKYLAPWLVKETGE